MTKADKAKYRAEFVEIDQVRCQRSLSHYAERAWRLVEPGRRFVPGWHIDAISEHLTAVLNGEIKDLIINIPPRHMKSLLVSVLFPSWAWAKKPELRWLFGSYAASLSIRDSVKCRRIITSDWYQERWGKVYQLTGDQNAKEKYENNRTGHRIATSVGGAATGEGGDIIVIDDPHKVTESESEPVREHTIDWFDGEMSTRGNDPKKVARIIVMQRVHEKDLSGHLLAQTGWEHLMLPAEYEPERKIVTSIGWEDPRLDKGDLLWPDRFGRTEIDKMKRQMGSQRAAGQLQQRPSPAEGNLVKRDWWKFYRKRPETFDRIGLSADLTFKEGKKNDYTVFQVWGKVAADKYLLKQVRKQMGFNSQIKALRNLVIECQQEGLNIEAKWIEDAANAAALIDTLRKEIPGLIPVAPRGSKYNRAEAIAPQIESGNVWLPHPETCPVDELGQPWVNAFIEEWAMFPNGGNDDQVDGTSLGVSQLSTGASFEWTPISITGTSKWLR